MDVSGKFHLWPIYTLRKRTPVHTEQEVRWASKPFWTFSNID